MPKLKSTKRKSEYRSTFRKISTDLGLICEGYGFPTISLSIRLKQRCVFNLRYEGDTRNNSDELMLRYVTALINYRLGSLGSDGSSSRSLFIVTPEFLRSKY